MKFLKYFYQIFESITKVTPINKDWTIKYNHFGLHDLDKKMLERTSLDEVAFNDSLQKIIKIIDLEKLNGDWVFMSFKYSCKIITNINFKNKIILIVTFLGKYQETYETKNIKLI